MAPNCRGGNRPKLVLVALTTWRRAMRTASGATRAAEFYGTMGFTIETVRHPGIGEQRDERRPCCPHLPARVAHHNRSSRFLVVMDRQGLPKGGTRTLCP